MYAPSIDRIDNTRGYIKDNIIIVSRRANILKKDATIDELRKLANYYEHFCHK
jgi:cupin superfamily acireductone dioxygenase involved in methionine salvage